MHGGGYTPVAARFLIRSAYGIHATKMNQRADRAPERLADVDPGVISSVIGAMSGFAARKAMCASRSLAARYW